MKLNTFLWNSYKETQRGKDTIRLFAEGSAEELMSPFQNYFYFDFSYAVDLIDDLENFAITPVFPEEMDEEDAEKVFDRILVDGIRIKDKNGEDQYFECGDYSDLLCHVPILSVWLYSIYPDFYKPYFWFRRMRELTQIADAFGMDLPEIPAKRNMRERVRYYWKLCEVFNQFQEENDLTPEEFCAFLYDFAPEYIKQSGIEPKELPQPTQAWVIGGNKGGGDLEVMDNSGAGDKEFWQGNVETKRGDIIVMYCLAPVSAIHSIWRAASDGIVDPFFYYYSNIYIGEPHKVTPITLKELKNDPYFSTHSLVRRNFQGVNGCPLSAEDYEALLSLLLRKGQNTSELPKLYSPKFLVNKSLHNEREVELQLVEPLLEKLGFAAKDWVRQLPVRMGRGERNYPDYAFFATTAKGYEKAKMLLEAKFAIKNNKDLEETFKQAHSYALRLESAKLILCDKDAIWIYERENGSFDRSLYIKKYWNELSHPDEYNKIKKWIGPQSLETLQKIV